jgi:hypothetical protein
MQSVELGGMDRKLSGHNIESTALSLVIGSPLEDYILLISV